MGDKKFTMIELKKAGAAVADHFGVDVVTGCKLLGFYNAGSHKDEKIVADIVAGEFSAVPVAAAALKINIGRVSGLPKNKIPVKKNSHRSSKNPSSDPEKGRKGSADGVNTTAGKKEKQTEGGAAYDVNGAVVSAEIVAALPAGVLPDNVPALVMDVIDSYCEQNNISDLSKERQPRWGAACYMVGASVFKPSKILHDIQKEKINGGMVYDVGRVSALVDLWGVLCQNFCKAPLIDDFARFAGLSDSWLYGVGSPDGLTPPRASLLQKLKRMQESGLSSMIVDGRQNPTGALAALNHWHGWTQTREIIHSSAAAAPSAPVLPVFDGSAGFLTDSGTDSGAESK